VTANVETVERTPVPDRVDTGAIRDLCQRRREEHMTGVWLRIEDVESMLIEVDLYRAKFDAASRRQRDGAKPARGRMPPKITLANVDEHDGEVL
jgi:hypothetical protein